MHLSFVMSKIEFIGKDDKAGLQTLRTEAQKVLMIKMSFQTPIVLEKLIGQILVNFAHVTLVVFLVQMGVQLRQIVKALGLAKFAQWMSPKGRSLVALIHVRFDLIGRKARQIGNEIPMILHT